MVMPEWKNVLFVLIVTPGFNFTHFFFFFNDTATTEIYTLSLHDALPISERHGWDPITMCCLRSLRAVLQSEPILLHVRSEEHTSELQSPCNLVCRLLLAKKTARHTPETPGLHPDPQADPRGLAAAPACLA